MLGAAAIAIVAGYLLVRPSVAAVPFPPVLLAVTVAAVPIGLLLLARPGAWLLAAVAVAIVIPHKTSHVWLLPPFLVGVGLVVERVRWRPAKVDLVFAGWLGWLAVSWIAHPGLGIGAKEFVQMALALGFYLFARMLVTPAGVTSVLWCLLVAGTAAAATVLVEWALGARDRRVQRSVAVPVGRRGGEIYRPGGVFGGSPAAADRPCDDPALDPLAQAATAVARLGLPGGDAAGDHGYLGPCRLDRAGRRRGRVRDPAAVSREGPGRLPARVPRARRRTSHTDRSRTPGPTS